MYTGVGASRAIDLNRRLGHLREYALEFALHSPAIRLDLPARKIRAVVADDCFEVLFHHGGESSTRAVNESRELLLWFPFKGIPLRIDFCDDARTESSEFRSVRVFLHE